MGFMPGRDNSKWFWSVSSQESSIFNVCRQYRLKRGILGGVNGFKNRIRRLNCASSNFKRSISNTETEYVSQMLTKIKRFALHHSVHVWFVAHPRQLHYWVGGPPNLYDISGSAHFINKCDNGIVVHRNRDPEAGPMDRVQWVCVQKVRNKVAGTVGDAFFSYNRCVKLIKMSW
ncbi:hypothetical protein Q3G72_007587 [Acer saccharum]|nr:hypothetical protein Q3G72_007587 [Acer saccharum]